jgi:hypothetical protein
MHFPREAVKAGALMGYGASVTDIYYKVTPAGFPVLQLSRLKAQSTSR